MDFTILNIELQDAKYSGVTDTQVATVSMSHAACMNTVNIPKKQVIKVHDIRKYLALLGKLMPLEASADIAATTAVRMLELFEDSGFDAADPNVLTKITTSLTDLVTATLLDEADKTYILALGDTLISRATELSLPVLKTANVTHARSL